MPLIPSTTSEKPSNSETNVDPDMDTATMRRKIEAAMDDAGDNNAGSGVHPAAALGIHGAVSTSGKLPFDCRRTVVLLDRRYMGRTSSAS